MSAGNTVARGRQASGDGRASARAERTRRRRADGERSRRRILTTAARLATVEGIDGLSIGRLAEEIGMSKSGLFAHFGSKEELQLAAIDTAEDIFVEDVIAPSKKAATGLARVGALSEGMLSHIDRQVFPGGCFFASLAAEVNSRPGPVLTRVTEVADAWLHTIAAAVAEAQADGDLDPSLDPLQLAFEVNSFLQSANTLYQLGDRDAIQRGRSAVRGRLDAARA